MIGMSFEDHPVPKSTKLGGVYLWVCLSGSIILILREYWWYFVDRSASIEGIWGWIGNVEPLENDEKLSQITRGEWWWFLGYARSISSVTLSGEQNSIETSSPILTCFYDFGKKKARMIEILCHIGLAAQIHLRRTLFRNLSLWKFNQPAYSHRYVTLLLHIRISLLAETDWLSVNERPLHWYAAITSDVL